METDNKWGPVRINHAVIGVGPLRHHKSSCWECSTDSITTKVKAKRVLAVFCVALSSVWKDVCICLTPWHFFCCGSFILAERETRSDKNIVLYQPGESFSDLKLNAAVSSPGGVSPSVSQPVKKKELNDSSWETHTNGLNVATGGNLRSLNVHWMAINIQYSS